MQISALFFLLAYLIPNHYLPWMSFYSEFLVFLGLWILGVYFAKAEMKVGFSVVFFVFLSVVPVVQFASGVVFFFGDAWVAAFYLIACAASLVLGRALYDRHRGAAYAFFAWVFVLASIVSSGCSFYQWFGLAGGVWVLSIFEGGRAVGNLAQANHMATLLSLGLVSTLYLVEVRSLGRWSSSLIALVLIVAIALTQSRTPWVGAACLLMWWGVKYRAANLTLRPAVLGVWCVFYLLSVFFLEDVRELLYLERQDETLLDRTLSSQRLLIWGQVVQAILDGPLWGYGWNQVGVAQVSAALTFPVQLLSLHAHNIILDLLVWNGPLLGGAIVIFIAGWLFVLARRSVTPGAVFALLASGLVLLHGLLEYPLEYAYFLIPVCLLLGMVEGEVSMVAWVKSAPLLRYFALSSCAVVLIAVWVEYRVIEEDHRLLRFEMGRIGGIKADHDAPDVVLLSQLREMIRLARTEVVGPVSPEELEWMRQVAYRYPYIPCLYRYSMALALNGSLDESIDVLLRLRSIYGEGDYQMVLAGLREEAVKKPALNALYQAIAVSR
ncbi:hypothetical protein FXN65_04455 [Metapseudomonas lalkuanensis]|uniref:Polymerase n=1 Tax=Metapseudomonas lalkuanensis TaxID=2604832 RepID=A0A5J6QKI3_9GAMM|nr:Wzy polymerase domain-containing protein [Pseudomonas lalkuanensis]QEY61336.1 hypothetical protein FXN65_04455 [Pseudomonas lalkuanensis]